MVGLSLAWTGLLVVAIQIFVTGRAVRRFGEKRAGLFGLTSGTTGFILFAIAPFGWTLFVIMPVMAFQALIQPSLIAMMSHRVPHDMQGELQGFNGSLTALGTMAAPLIFNPTLAWFTGPQAPVYFAGAPFVIAAVIGLAAIAMLALSPPRASIDPAD
jgi:DHA1 family tetracycline resistance protein-like MFS transporter